VVVRAIALVNLTKFVVEALITADRPTEEFFAGGFFQLRYVVAAYPGVHGIG
jgi:hypothetical protein